MKINKVFFLAFLPLLFWACGNSTREENIKVTDIHIPVSADDKKTDQQTADMPVITFEKNVHDFGRVLQGEKLSYSFKFTNTGKSNLIIQGADASCGCTTTAPPKAPIRPGESAHIKVTFDSKGKEGDVNNIVVVTANTYPVQTVVRVTANVITP